MFRRLKALGILGINARIATYMNRLNARKHYPLVDDKVQTTILAKAHNIPMPETYFVFESYGNVGYLHEILRPHHAFVIKPAHGAMGNGIIVIDHREGDHFVKPSGERLSLADIRYHILQIMSGLYSLGGETDHAILQHKIDMHPAFDPYVYQGVADIRIIVYCGYPVMAMARLPTKASDGRGNLHQGAVGAGIDLRTGHITSAMLNDKIITHHPDTGRALTDIVIPDWLAMLRIAAQCYEITEMGYLGVDIVLDVDQGPMVLEMNARPGLSIQVANQQGLLKALQQFAPYVPRHLPTNERVELAQRINDMGVNSPLDTNVF